MKGNCKNCNQEVIIHARGMCQNCYQKAINSGQFKKRNVKLKVVNVILVLVVIAKDIIIKYITKEKLKVILQEAKQIKMK